MARVEAIMVVWGKMTTELDDILLQSACYGLIRKDNIDNPSSMTCAKNLKSATYHQNGLMAC